VRDGRPAEPEHREDVRAEDPLDLLRRVLLDRVVGHLEGGVVDEHVEAAELVDGALDQLPAVRLVADVAAHDHGPPPGVLDEPARLLGVLVLGEVGDEHVGALAGEGEGHGAADPRIRPGHERDPVGQAAEAAVGLLPVVGGRPHLGLGARRRLRRLVERRAGAGHGGIWVRLAHPAGLPR
jgi:hypothetical protein